MTNHCRRVYSDAYPFFTFVSLYQSYKEWEDDDMRQIYLFKYDFVSSSGCGPT